MKETFLDYINVLRNAHIEKEFNNFKKSWEKYKKIIILGNGGSNAVASHISQDYVKFHRKKSLIFSDPSSAIIISLAPRARASLKLLTVLIL